MSKEKVIDINSEQEVLEKTEKLIHALEAGIQAIAMDFGYHIKNTFSETKIFSLRDSISYRLNSSKFHLNLIFKQLVEIQAKHDKLSISGDIRNHPLLHLEFDKRQLSYLLDSIVFHLSSIFDYSAILINYVVNKTDDTPSWNKMESYARENSNLFKQNSRDEIREAVKDIHKKFVRHLYDYRSDIIHRIADVLRADYAWEIVSNKKTLLFLCSQLQQKRFKNLGEISASYTLSFFIQYLMSETIEAVANILRVLRNFMEKNSNNDKLMKEGKVMIVQAGANGQVQSPSVLYWGTFDKIFYEHSL